MLSPQSTAPAFISSSAIVGYGFLFAKRKGDSPKGPVLLTFAPAVINSFTTAPNPFSIAKVNG